MKIIKNIRFAISIVLLAGVAFINCSNLKSNDIKEFVQNDLVLVSENGTKELELNHTAYISQDYTAIEEHATFDMQEEDAQYKLSRDIGIGSAIEDYVAAYGANNNSIVWEMCTNDNYVQFEEYSGLDKDVPSIEDGVAWLDVGFCKNGNQWKPLKDTEIADIWFCEAAVELYDEVVIISVSQNSSGKIDAVVLNYFDYTPAFIDYQAWDE